MWRCYINGVAGARGRGVPTTTTTTKLTKEFSVLRSSATLLTVHVCSRGYRGAPCWHSPPSQCRSSQQQFHHKSLMTFFPLQCNCLQRPNWYESVKFLFIRTSMIFFFFFVIRACKGALGCRVGMVTVSVVRCVGEGYWIYVPVLAYGIWFHKNVLRKGCQECSST